MVTQKTRKPGPKRLDPVKRAQILHWYWNTKFISKLSDPRLYLACFNDSPERPLRGEGADRRKIFERVRKECARPDRKDKRRPYVLLDVVEKHFPGTKAQFDSDFWPLLIAPRLNYARLTDIMQRLLKNCGFVRPTSASARYLSRSMGSSGPLEDQVKRWPSELHRQAFSELAKRGNLDSLALLTGLAIELQMQRPDPLVAMLAKEIHIHCKTAFGKIARTLPWKQVRTELWFWYQMRVFYGVWDNPWNMGTIMPGSGWCLMPLLPAKIYGRTLAKIASSGPQVNPEILKHSYERTFAFHGINPPWNEPESAQ